MVNVESNSSNSNERCSITTTISEDSPWYSQFRNASNPWMARYVYGFIFLVANLLAWASRDELSSLSALLEMKGFRGCKVGKDCLGTEGVLRVSMGCFMFYVIMFWSTVGTSKLNVVRDKWHSGWWSIKIVLWIATTIFPFLLPSQFIQFYGQVSHFGAGVFLLIQLISIISFITWLNDRWVSEKYAERCQIHVVIFATIAYCVCLGGIILMYFWYAPQPTCLLNLFFITWTLLLLQIITSVSLHSKVNAGILSPGLMGLYVVYLCWSAMRSEPAGARCIVKSDSATTTDWQSIISFVVAILAIVIATFSTGIDSKCFQSRKDDTPAEDDVPYGYGFFHLVFATGAMYFAMILIGWNSHHSMRKWTIDVGWTSTWVRIINEWLAVLVYLWMVLAPIIWKTRYTDSS
ncbi:putative serine incorporator/TMS membrane protein [Lupinus albus]|uniref:Putative serine incorporator/TMS membrane protein n=1 Tax=Lupinus albus TaxID=3870 RepID=A0A6A4MZZ7_LUPAL|nr:putative serine incorporator/TMS membrane protein [Lupinus albus]